MASDDTSNILRELSAIYAYPQLGVTHFKTHTVQEK